MQTVFCLFIHVHAKKPSWCFLNSFFTIQTPIVSWGNWTCDISHCNQKAVGPRLPVADHVEMEAVVTDYGGVGVYLFVFIMYFLKKTCFWWLMYINNVSCSLHCNVIYIYKKETHARRQQRERVSGVGEWNNDFT